MDTYMAHHGVQGQKWGERRYQNSDGSLTPAGRAHYGVGDVRAPSSGGEHGTARVKIKQAQSNVKAASGFKKGSDSKEGSDKPKKTMTKKELIDSGDVKLIDKHKGELSTVELRQAMDRIKANKELAELANKKSSFATGGKKFVSQVVNESSNGLSRGIGKGVAVFGAAATVAGGQYLVKKLLGDETFKEFFGGGAKSDDIVRAALSNLAQKK